MPLRLMRPRQPLLTWLLAASVLVSQLANQLFAASELRHRHSLPFTEQAAADQSWVAFKRGLLAAAPRRDKEFLRRVLDKDFRSGFDVEVGDVSATVGRWKPDKRFWRMLIRALNLGGGFVGSGSSRYYVAPYVVATWPESIDPYRHLAVITASASVHSRPHPAAPVVATVGREVVAIEEQPIGYPTASTAGAGWVKIRTASGIGGFIASIFTYSPIGYRAYFRKTAEGEWKFWAFVSGD